MFIHLKEQYPTVLYALQGANDTIDYDKLSDEIKLDLKHFRDCMKEKQKYILSFLWRYYG